MLTLFSWKQDRNALIQSLSTNPEFLKNKVKFLTICSSFILVQCFGGRFKMQMIPHAGIVMAKGGISFLSVGYVADN